MNALGKGLLVAAAQVALAASVGAKFLADRVNHPRVWVETAPFDPDLPIRGRYVSIALLVDAKRDAVPDADTRNAGTMLARLEVQGDRLVAVEDDAGKHWVAQIIQHITSQFRRCCSPRSSLSWINRVVQKERGLS